MFIVNQIDHQMDKLHGCKIRAKHVKYFHTVLDNDATALSIRQHELGMIHLALSDALLDASRCIKCGTHYPCVSYVTCITDAARTPRELALYELNAVQGGSPSCGTAVQGDVPKIKKITRFWRHSHRGTCQGADRKTHLVCT